MKSDVKILHLPYFFLDVKSCKKKKCSLIIKHTPVEMLHHYQHKHKETLVLTLSVSMPLSTLDNGLERRAKPWLLAPLHLGAYCLQREKNTESLRLSLIQRIF